MAKHDETKSDETPKSIIHSAKHGKTKVNEGSIIASNTKSGGITKSKESSKSTVQITKLGDEKISDETAKFGKTKENVNASEGNFKQEKKHSIDEDKYLTTREKLSVIVSMLFRCFLPVFFVFFSQYMLLQAVITTISYQNAPFPPRDHYQYYIFIYMVGEFLGRCHRAILRFINPALLYKETSLKLWMVSLTQVAHVVFFGLESWFRFLPGVHLALFFTFTAGLAVGILFNNMLEYLSVALTGKEKEFMLGYISFPMFCGSFVAALVGISAENFLKAHCESSIVETSFCLTRVSALGNFTSSCG